MRESFKIFIVILSFSLSNGQDKLTVNDAVKLALENNLDIKISENQNEILKNNASFLNSGYLPRVSSRVGFNKSNQNIEIETPNNLSSERIILRQEKTSNRISL